MSKMECDCDMKYGIHADDCKSNSAQASDAALDEELAAKPAPGKLRARIAYKHVGLTDATVTLDGHEIEDCNGVTIKHDAGALPQVELSFLIVEGVGDLDMTDLDAEVTVATTSELVPLEKSTQPHGSGLHYSRPTLALMRGGSLHDKVKLIPRSFSKSNHWAMCVRFPAIASVVDGVETVVDEFYQMIFDDSDARGYDKLLHYQYVGHESPYRADSPWRGDLTWEQADAIHVGAFTAAEMQPIALAAHRQRYAKHDAANAEA